MENIFVRYSFIINDVIPAILRNEIKQSRNVNFGDFSNQNVDTSASINNAVEI